MIFNLGQVQKYLQTNNQKSLFVWLFIARTKARDKKSLKMMTYNLSSLATNNVGHQHTTLRARCLTVRRHDEDENVVVGPRWECQGKTHEFSNGATSNHLRF
jgi:hypothetical protein